MLKSDLALLRRVDWRTDQLCQDAARALAEAIEQVNLLRVNGKISADRAQRCVGRLRTIRATLESPT